MPKTNSEKLTQLRRLMKERELDFYYVPSSDAHNNEYVPKPWRRREWMSGFTGSAGQALIGLNQAFLWTDGRYLLQAEMELDKNDFQIMPLMPNYPRIDEWLAHQGKKLKIGVDPKLMTIAEFQRFEKNLAESKSQLIPYSENLVDLLRPNDPPIQAQPIQIYPMEYAGETVASKINHALQGLQAENAQMHIISALDAIAWLFNIRGKDVEFNPLVLAYAIIGTTIEPILYLHTEILSKNDKAYFAQQKIKIRPYSEFSHDLQKIRGKTLVDPTLSSYWILQNLVQAEIILKTSPITLMKACKNQVEQKGMQEAHRRDALAMCQFLFWLENNWAHETEISAAKKVNEFRKSDPFCQDLSFTTISGYGAHGAIIHYSVNEKTNSRLGDDSLYLVDSGGQYLQGTTDITRTLHLGSPTSIQKKHYTLVLKAHLNLGHAIFPKGTTGDQLNVLAHEPLWREGLDFPHGTGHGVGCYLCVHEGPQSISSFSTGIALRPGMMLSNEPGLYLEGEYGIRIENVCVVKETISQNDSPTKSGPFYQFQDLTLVPYEKKLMDLTLLSDQEMEWINQYHERIYHTLSNDLPEDVAKWLRQKTSPLEKQ